MIVTSTALKSVLANPAFYGGVSILCVNCGKPARAAREIYFEKKTTMSVVMEKRIVFELRDILKVRLECGLCGGEFSPSMVVIEKATRCPACKKVWTDKDHELEVTPKKYMEEMTELEEFLKRFYYFAEGNYPDRVKERKVPWRIFLELPGDPD